MTYQVTLFSTTGKFKPISCLIESESVNLNNAEDVKLLAERGTKKICFKKYWGKTDLVKYGYTKVKVREYNPEKIKAENEKRYAEIKEQKYASGEWKRPKGE